MNKNEHFLVMQFMKLTVASTILSSVGIDKHWNYLVISSCLEHCVLIIFGLGITNCYCLLEFSQVAWQFSTTAEQQKFF